MGQPAPSEYRRKAGTFDRRFCGTSAGDTGPLRRALDGFPEVRVSHERNATVTTTHSYLCIQRRRTRYRTALGASKRLVCNFWSKGELKVTFRVMSGASRERVV